MADFCEISEYFEKYCPSLKHLWTQYLEHDAVMVSQYAGPQGDSKEKPNFGFEVDDGRIGKDEQVFFECYEDHVLVRHCFDDCQETSSMTHQKCLKYLSQLPRPWYSFCDDIAIHLSEKTPPKEEE